MCFRFQVLLRVLLTLLLCCFSTWLFCYVLLIAISVLSVFPVKFPIQVLIFCLCSLRESRFSYKLILLLHRLVHLIPLFFVGIYVSTWFIFPISLLIVLYSMFLSDGKLVFCSFLILFKFSKFIFCLVLVFALCCSMLGASIFRNFQFISVSLFLFVSTWCIWYCFTVLFIICFPVYF